MRTELSVQSQLTTRNPEIQNYMEMQVIGTLEYSAAMVLPAFTYPSRRLYPISGRYYYIDYYCREGRETRQCTSN